MSYQPTLNNETFGFDAVSMQKELQNELAVAHQQSFEFTEINNQLQQQLEEQYAINHTLNANITDLEMQIDLLEAQNEEYLHNTHQTNDKYEEAINELSITRQQLTATTHQIQENEHTIQSLNNDLLHIASNTPAPLKPLKNGHSPNNNHRNPTNNIDYKQKLKRQLSKYDELVKECEQLIEQHIEFENVKKDTIEFQERNKQLSQQIVELTYSNVHLEKELADDLQQIDQQNELIHYLQTENQNLTTKLSEKHSPLKTQNIKLNSPHFKYPTKSPKIVPAAQQKQTQHRSSISLTEFNKLDGIDMDSYDSEDEHGNDMKDTVEAEAEAEGGNDLFTMVQNCENNEEYLINSYQHCKSKNVIKKNTTDALEEYLHLTASAVKINYPNVDASIKELLALVRNIPFYQAYDEINKYMADKLSTQNGLCTVSVGAVPQKGTVTRLLTKVRRASVTALNPIIPKKKVVTALNGKKKVVIKIQRSKKSQKNVIDYDKLQKKLQQKSKSTAKSNKISKKKKNKGKKQKYLHDVIVFKDGNDEIKSSKKKRRKLKRKSKTETAKVIIV